MPQFWLGDFAPQLVWLAISFILLYFLMAKVALPRLGDILEDRQNRIADDVDQAEQLRASAEKVMADYEKALAEAQAKAQATIAETAQRMNDEAEQLKSEIDDRLAKEAEAAAKRITDAKTAALSDMRGMAGELASSICEKLTGDSADAAAVETAVDAAMREVS